MKVNLGIWDKLSRLIVFLIVASAIVGVVRWYLPLIQENELRRQQLGQLEERIREELQESNRLSASLASFQDPTTVERMARETLRYARSNEVIFHFNPPEQP